MSERPTGRHAGELLQVLLLVVLVCCAAATTLLLPPDRTFAVAAQMAELATYPVMLAAAALLYGYYRLTPGDGTAWLATAAVFGTTQGLGYAAMRLVLEDEVAARPGWLLLSQVFVAMVMVGLLSAHRLPHNAVDPFLVGICLGVAITAVRLALVDRVEPAPVLQELMPTLEAALLMLHGVMAALLMRHERLPRWASGRLAAVVVLLGLAQVLTYPVPHEDGRSLVATALSIGGSTLLVATSLGLVRNARVRQEAVEQKVRTLEAHHRIDRTLLHEVAGTAAGIAAASRMLWASSELSADERHRLEELLVSETTRLDHLLASPIDDPVVDLDLDPLVSSAVLAQRIRGRTVAWSPTGHHVRGRADHVVEVLNLLLDNAALHSGGTTFEVTSAQEGDEIHVAVVDHGRGIPPEIAETVLEWGTHGSRSSGQGIGLSVACHLVTDMGGRLTLGSGDFGTRATVHLPVATEAKESAIARLTA